MHSSLCKHESVGDPGPARAGGDSVHRVFQTMAAKNGTTGPRPGSLKYAAAKIGCSLPTLYELIDDGKLRSYHIGRAHRICDQAIADCIALLERENAEARLHS